MRDSTQQNETQEQQQNQSQSDTSTETQQSQEIVGSQPTTPNNLPVPIQLLIPEIALMMRIMGPMSPPLRIVIQQTTEPAQTQTESESETETETNQSPTTTPTSSSDSPQQSTSPQVRQIIFFFPTGPVFPTEEQILNIMFNLQRPQGPPPASQQAIDNLPNIILDEKDQAEQPRCSICCDEFMTGAEVTQLPCKHVYDKDCIITWLKLHNTCPVCRYSVRADDKNSEILSGSRTDIENNDNRSMNMNQEIGSVVELSNEEERISAPEPQDATKEVWEVDSSDNNNKIKDDMRIEGADEPRTENREETS
jgi:hypothetical protein